MVYLEKYNRYIAEAKEKIGELALESATLSGRGFDSQPEVTLAMELQYSLEFLTDPYCSASEVDKLRVMDHYVAKAKLVVCGLIL